MQTCSYLIPKTILRVISPVIFSIPRFQERSCHVVTTCFSLFRLSQQQKHTLVVSEEKTCISHNSRFWEIQDQDTRKSGVSVHLLPTEGSCSNALSRWSTKLVLLNLFYEVTNSIPENSALMSQFHPKTPPRTSSRGQ